MVGQTQCLNFQVTLVGKWLAVWLRCACWWVIGLQVAYQTYQAFLVGIMIFPVSKVTNMPCSSDVGGPGQVGLHDHLVEFDGKEHWFVLMLFFLKSSHDFVFNPCAIDGVFREDDQELIVQANRLINAMPKLLSDLQVFRGEPAPDAFGLQVSIETLCELLVFTGIANEACEVLDRVLNQGTNIGNEGISQTCPA